MSSTHISSSIIHTKRHPPENDLGFRTTSYEGEVQDWLLHLMVGMPCWLTSKQCKCPGIARAGQDRSRRTPKTMSVEECP